MLSALLSRGSAFADLILVDARPIRLNGGSALDDRVLVDARSISKVQGSPFTAAEIQVAIQEALS